MATYPPLCAALQRDIIDEFDEYKLWAMQRSALYNQPQGPLRWGAEAPAQDKVQIDEQNMGQ